MRVLYAAMGDACSQAVRGAPYEDRFFRDSLRRLPGVRLEHFDYAAIQGEIGIEAMSQALMRRAVETEPDLLFLVPCNPTVDPLHAAVAAITAKRCTTTLAWMCDDPWQFADYSRRWASCVDWLVTTDPDCLPRYAAAGGARVVLSQWAADAGAFDLLDVPLDIDVSFVGRAHGSRREVIDRLRAAGLPVATFGSGWTAASAPLSAAAMAGVFQRTKINLNFGESLDRSCQQIKARNFEVTAGGGFLLTAAVPHLDRYFELGKEIATFADADELAAKVRYYLAHDDERRAIAARGRARCARDHTWELRLADLLAQIAV